ncbi:MAG: beta-galactosidase trimerization domain-containing protein [Ferruginibacter sp.]
MKNISLVVCLIIFSIVGKAQLVIGSFEKESDLENITTTDGASIRRSSDFPALGGYSLQTSFAKNGGSVILHNLGSANFFRDVADQDAFTNTLLLFFWATSPSDVTVLIRDSTGKSSGKQFVLKAGANHLQISLADVANVDLGHVQSIEITTNREATFYVDYIALDTYQPVLAARGRWDVPYSAAVETNHIPWATPLAAGTIRSYSISPVFDGRGIIELGERLDLDYKVASLGRRSSENRWGFGDFYHRRNPSGYDVANPNSLAFNYIADDLLYSAEFDVIIWPGLFKWEDYPVQIREAILTRVKNGTGLLLIYPKSDNLSDSGLWAVSPLRNASLAVSKKMVKAEQEGDNSKSIWPLLDVTKWSVVKPHFITRGIALEAFPAGHIGVVPMRGQKDQVLLQTAQGNPVLATGTYGKGRVVAMSYAERGLIPSIDDPWQKDKELAYWEYMWSMVARATVWAARKEPVAYITNVAQTTGGLTVQFHAITARASLTMQIVDDFNRVKQDTTLVLSPGQQNINIGLNSMISGGKYIANLQLKGDKGVYDWYSLAFATRQAATITAVAIQKAEIPVGENVTATVTLKTANQLSGILQARLFDNYGRLADSATYPVQLKGEKKLSVQFKSANVLSHLGKMDFVLMVDGREADHKVKELFFLQPRKWDDYDVTMYHFGPNPLPGTWDAIDQQLKKIQVTTLAAYTVENSKHANYKVQAQTRINGVESPDKGPDLDYYNAMKKKYLETGDKKLLVRKYGLNDSVYLKSVKEDLKKKVAVWKKFSPSAYYVYEEPSITRYDDALDLDFSNTTLTAMRKWLTGQYGSLQALNQQWGTSFTSWAAVVPDDSKEAKKRGNTSSWADHRSFMEKTWAAQFKYVQDALNEFDPGGLVQLSGTQAAGAHNGYDYSQIDKYVGQMNPYDIGNQLEYHRNFNPAVKISGQGGYGALGKGVLFDFYKHAFVNETAGAYIFWQQSVLNPDLQICASGNYLKEALYEMKEKGIGRLISNFQPDNENKIAIHYSYPSIHAAWIADGEIKMGNEQTSKTLEQFRSNLDGWVKVLHDAGVGFDFMAYSSIENNDLVTKGYKILVLPMSIALSDKEVKQIQEFVQQGGTVVADALPGVMDGHTRYRNVQALAEVFGIKAQGFSREDLITPSFDVRLTPLDGKANSKENNRPILLSHRFGKGKAFLLNYFLNKYPGEKLTKTNASSLSKIRQVLTEAGVTSGVEITTTSRSLASGITKYAFAENGGSGKLLGLLPDENLADTVVTLNLTESYHLYNVRNSTYLGEGKNFKLSLSPGVPMLFGMLKGTVNGLNAVGPTAVRRGDKVVIQINCTGDKLLQLQSVAAIAIYDPKGELMEVYSGNCSINASHGEFSFSTAFNDEVGDWTIKVKEVMTGVGKEIKVTVQ